MPDRDDTHDHHRDSELDRHTHSREVVIRDGGGGGPKFQVDIKAVLLIGGTIVTIAGSWFEQKARISNLDYEIRAEITRVENASDKRVSSLEQKLVQIQATNCAIARSLKVLTSECGRSEQ